MIAINNIMPTTIFNNGFGTSIIPDKSITQTIKPMTSTTIFHRSIGIHHQL